MGYELYVITDRAAARGRSHAGIARLAIEGGADVVQLRDKACSAEELVRAGRTIARLAHRAGTLFIVNDRIDCAIACGADGVHLGQGDMPVAAARRIAPAGFIIGASATTGQQAAEAAVAGADYIAASPVFPTPSKTDTPAFCGLSGIRRIRAAVRLPLVAIGGIGPQNARDAILAGADGVAVISAVTGQPDITGAARALKAIVREAKEERSRRAGGRRP